jgi:hypothetical protein
MLPYPVYPLKKRLCFGYGLLFWVFAFSLASLAENCGASQKEPAGEVVVLQADSDINTPEQENASLQQKLPPRVAEFLSELGSEDARALLGAFNEGYTIIKRLGDGMILARKSSEKNEISELSVISADFIISFNSRQENKQKQFYHSVITQGGFECKSARLALMYQQFQAGVFGTGVSVSAYESSQPAHFRSLSKGLSKFLSTVYCTK